MDVQNDFISGSLALKNSPACQDGEEVVQIINNILEENTFDFVVYTMDWHPEDHCSFVTNVDKYPLHESSTVSAEDAKVFDKVIYDGEKPIEQVMWPPHCIQDSEGAELHQELKVRAFVCFNFKSFLLGIFKNFHHVFTVFIIISDRQRHSNANLELTIF